MKYLRKINIILIASLCTFATGAIAAPKLNSTTKTQLNGIGNVRVGMTVKEASQAAGIELVPFQGQTDKACGYVHPKRGWKDVAMMVAQDRIVRIDIYGGSSIKTLKGAGNGDSEARIKSLYPGRIKVSPHPYTKGHYLTFVPADKADRQYMMIFETDGRKVVQYRVGKSGDVQAIEGCS
jgi:hypothetical protein